MSNVLLWKSNPDLRPWASVNALGREHLLAQLLHANLLDDASCKLVLDSAAAAAADAAYERDLGFFDSVAVHFLNQQAVLDHVISEYGTFALPAAELAVLIQLWMTVLQSPVEIEREFNVKTNAYARVPGLK